VANEHPCSITSNSKEHSHCLRINSHSHTSRASVPSWKPKSHYQLHVHNSRSPAKMEPVSHPTPLRYILILSSHLCLALEHGAFPFIYLCLDIAHSSFVLGFLTNICCGFLTSPTGGTRSDHLTLLALIILLVFDEVYTLYRVVPIIL
jgi:hypothetical protein